MYVHLRYFHLCCPSPPFVFVYFQVFVLTPTSSQSYSPTGLLPSTVITQLLAENTHRRLKVETGLVAVITVIPFDLLPEAGETLP